MRFWISESFKPCFIHSATFFRCASSKFIFCPARLWRLTPWAQLSFSALSCRELVERYSQKTSSTPCGNLWVDRDQIRAPDHPARNRGRLPGEDPGSSSDSEQSNFPVSGMRFLATVPDGGDAHPDVGDKWSLGARH